MTARQELLELANLWCEQDLTPVQFDRMQSLLRSNAELRSVFLRFLQVHGLLVWDGGNHLSPSSDQEDLQQAALSCCSDPDLILADFAGASRRQKRSQRVRAMLMAGVVVCALAAGWLTRDAAVVNRDGGSQTVQAIPVTPVPEELQDHGDGEALKPLQSPVQIVHQQPAPETPAPPEAIGTPIASVSPRIVDDAAIVSTIDKLIARAWAENQVQPAKRADDYEWIRRLSLVLTGSISSSEDVAEFVGSKSPSRRQLLAESLTLEAATADNLAGIWTNLLIGRSEKQGVDRESLRQFLTAQFAENKSWMETACRLIAAEGRNDEQGETNFLLAHLNAQATPATAVTAKLFLGHQVHCTQCHDHPFVRERGQQEFWALNAFFKTSVRKPAPDSRAWILTQDGEAGMTFYENRRGQQIAVLPEFAGETVDSDVSRRTELARILQEKGQSEIARAMVNRIWAMFFGYGFTNPIDDLGPHNPPSHPELFDHLIESFIAADFDVRRLMRWLAMTEAFGLSSIPTESVSDIDQPERGTLPLFSRAYPRPLGPEQVYDSLHAAINSVAGSSDSRMIWQHRSTWVGQFVRSWGNDENEETLAFDCNVAQALLMMNDRDLEQAIPAAVEAILAMPDRNSANPDRRLLDLSMAALNRQPTENERSVFRTRIRTLSKTMTARDALRSATEDMFWAYLNSAEFSSVH